eukprot:2376555-Amphidinium_carterae.1
MPNDFQRTSQQFTHQDFYFVVIHTTEGLLREMKSDIEQATQSSDMTGWYSRKDQDRQYQIKAGEALERLGGSTKTVEVGKYMELKVAYKQKYRNAIENKLEYKQNHFHDYSIITTAKNLNDNYAVKMAIEIYPQAQTKRDELHPPHQNRFFLFLVQHYLPRLHNIFQRAGATHEEYNQVLLYFDKKCAVHFTRPNRRDLQMIHSAPQQTAEEVQQDLQCISQLPEMQTGRKTQSIPEEEIGDN